jgi:Ca2+-binding EF-hand superfamily protein
MKKIICMALCAASFVTAASAQTADSTDDYIDTAFEAMDFNEDGRIAHAEFDRFMRARLARQTAVFDEAFTKLDVDADGKISMAEAEAAPLLAQHFTTVDMNEDGVVDKKELRAAMLRAQAREQGIR